MPLGVSCTVVIHVSYAKIGNRLTADFVVVIHVPYASCEAVWQHIVLLCMYPIQVVKGSAVEYIVVIYVAYANCEAIRQ